MWVHCTETALNGGMRKKPVQPSVRRSQLLRRVGTTRSKPAVGEARSRVIITLGTGTAIAECQRDRERQQNTDSAARGSRAVQLSDNLRTAKMTRFRT